MNDYTTFLDSFFEQIKKARIDISGLTLDHIAYQASTAQNYDSLKPNFLALGDEASEEIIGERRVAVFKLYKPINYGKYAIQAMELMNPDPAKSVSQSGNTQNSS